MIKACSVRVLKRAISPILAAPAQHQGARRPGLKAIQEDRSPDPSNAKDANEGGKHTRVSASIRKNQEEKRHQGTTLGARALTRRSQEAQSAAIPRKESS